MLVQNLLGLASVPRATHFAKVIPLLEGMDIVDWPFQFFVDENACRIHYKLEGLKRILGMYVFYH